MKVGPLLSLQPTEELRTSFRYSTYLLLTRVFEETQKGDRQAAGTSTEVSRAPTDWSILQRRSPNSGPPNSVSEWCWTFWRRTANPFLKRTSLWSQRRCEKSLPKPWRLGSPCPMSTQWRSKVAGSVLQAPHCCRFGVLSPLAPSARCHCFETPFYAWVHDRKNWQSLHSISCRTAGGKEAFAVRDTDQNAMVPNGLRKRFSLTAWFDCQSGRIPYHSCRMRQSRTSARRATRLNIGHTSEHLYQSRNQVTATK